MSDIKSLREIKARLKDNCPLRSDQERWLVAEVERLRGVLGQIAKEQGPGADEPEAAWKAFVALNGREPTVLDDEWV